MYIYNRNISFGSKNSRSHGTISHVNRNVTGSHVNRNVTGSHVNRNVTGSIFNRHVWNSVFTISFEWHSSDSFFKCKC